MPRPQAPQQRGAYAMRGGVRGLRLVRAAHAPWIGGESGCGSLERCRSRRATRSSGRGLGVGRTIGAERAGRGLVVGAERSAAAAPRRSGAPPFPAACHVERRWKRPSIYPPPLH